MAYLVHEVGDDAVEGEALVVARLREVDEVAHGDRQLVLELRTREKQYRLIHAVRGVVGSEARHIGLRAGLGAQGGLWAARQRGT